MTTKRQRKGYGEYLGDRAVREHNRKVVLLNFFWVIVLTVILVGFGAMVWFAWKGYGI